MNTKNEKKEACVLLDQTCYSTVFVNTLRQIHVLRGNHYATKIDVILSVVQDSLRATIAADEAGKIDGLVQKGVLTRTKTGKFAIARRYW
ncbi:MAG: hypothetical protein WCJ39_05480 [bacterium]